MAFSLITIMKALHLQLMFVFVLWVFHVFKCLIWQVRPCCFGNNKIPIEKSSWVPFHPPAAFHMVFYLSAISEFCFCGLRGSAEMGENGPWKATIPFYTNQTCTCSRSRNVMIGCFHRKWLKIWVENVLFVLGKLLERLLAGWVETVPGLFHGQHGLSMFRGLLRYMVRHGCFWFQ